MSELCPQEIVERLQPSRCQTHRTIRYTLIECTCQIWAEWKGIAFSRAKIFFPFRSSPSPSLVTLRRNNLVDPSYKTICQTNPRPKFSMNQRAIYIVSKSKKFKSMRQQQFILEKGRGKKEEKKNSNEETICVQWLENWKQSTGHLRSPAIIRGDGMRKRWILV